MIHERARPLDGFCEPVIRRREPEAAAAAVHSAILRTEAFPGRPLQTLMVRLEIEAGAEIAAHAHPGLEIGYVLAGHGALGMPHLPPQRLSPGATFGVPRLAVHSLRSHGPGSLVIVATYVVEMDLPLSMPSADARHARALPDDAQRP